MIEINGIYEKGILWFANQNVLSRQIMGEWSFGQLMSQNSKVVHWPARLSETVELQLIIQMLIRETTMFSPCSSDSPPFFCCFNPYPVRFYPYLVHVVHHRAGKKVDFCKHGPMDRNSVKNCTTVTRMRQKLDNITRAFPNHQVPPNNGQERV
jgi:hypothetical protein